MNLKQLLFLIVSSISIITYASNEVSKIVDDGTTYFVITEKYKKKSAEIYTTASHVNLDLYDNQELDDIVSFDINNYLSEREQREHELIELRKSMSYILVNINEIGMAIQHFLPEYLDYLLSQNNFVTNCEDCEIDILHQKGLISPTHSQGILKHTKQFSMHNSNCGSMPNRIMISIIDLLDALGKDTYDYNYSSNTFMRKQIADYREIKNKNHIKKIQTIKVLTRYGFDWDALLSSRIINPNFYLMIKADLEISWAMLPIQPGAVRLPTGHVAEKTWWDCTKQILSSIADKLTDV